MQWNKDWEFSGILWDRSLKGIRLTKFAVVCWISHDSCADITRAGCAKLCMSARFMMPRASWTKWYSSNIISIVYCYCKYGVGQANLYPWPAFLRLCHQVASVHARIFSGCCLRSIESISMDGHWMASGWLPNGTNWWFFEGERMVFRWLMDGQWMVLWIIFFVHC